MEKRSSKSRKKKSTSEDIVGKSVSIKQLCIEITAHTCAIYVLTAITLKTGVLMTVYIFSTFMRILTEADTTNEGRRQLAEEPSRESL